MLIAAIASVTLFISSYGKISAERDKALAAERSALAAKSATEKELAAFKAAEKKRLEAELKIAAEQKKTAPLYLDKARKSINKRDSDSAMLDIKTALSHNINLVEARLLKAMIHISKKEYDKSLIELTAIKNNLSAIHKKFIPLCEKALKEGATPEILDKLNVVFLDLKEFSFASAQHKSKERLIAEYKKRFTKAGLDSSAMQINASDKIIWNTGLSGQQVSITPLLDLPIVELNLRQGLISSLNKLSKLLCKG